MNDRAAQEYLALRQTVQARGTARPWVCLTGFFAWAVCLLVVVIWLPNPLAAVVPLLLLVVTFEVIRSLHLAVERIGRYLQVFYEESSGADVAFAPPTWERIAMVLGPNIPGAGVHPFFLPLFLMATVINFMAVILPGPVALEMATLTVPHAAFIIWLLHCDRGMRKQRTTELARFRELKKDSLRS